jgi:hypothetical protein
MAKKVSKSARCRTSGCRRVAQGDGLCRGCTDRQEAAAPKDPMDVAKRLTREELLLLGKLSAEVEKELLMLKIIKMEAMELQREAEAALKEKMAAKERERQIHAEALAGTRRQYDALTLGLSKKHGIDDPKKMVVDTETGVIHDASTI